MESRQRVEIFARKYYPTLMEWHGASWQALQTACLGMPSGEESKFRVAQRLPFSKGNKRNTLSRMLLWQIEGQLWHVIHTCHMCCHQLERSLMEHECQTWKTWKKHEKTCQIYGEKHEKNSKKDEKSEGIKPLFFLFTVSEFRTCRKRTGKWIKSNFVKKYRGFRIFRRDRSRVKK